MQPDGLKNMGVISQESRIRNMKGFSLIEVAMVVFILTFVLIGLLMSSGEARARQSLNEAKELVVRVLEAARNRSATGYGASSHGVYIESDGITEFEGEIYVPGSGYKHFLPPLTSSDQTGTQIVFKRLTMQTNLALPIVITISNSKGDTETVNVSPSGAISGSD